MMILAAAAVVLFGVDASDAKRPYIEPIAIVEKRGARLTFEQPDTRDQKSFVRDYFGGKRYEVFSSGERVATAFAQSRVELSCRSLAAGVKLSNRLPYNLGLATSGPLIEQHHDTTREVTPAEQDALLALLRDRIGVDANQNTSFIAIDFDHDGHFEFVANGDVTAGRKEHQFLVIAGEHRGRMHAEYVYDHRKEADDDGDSARMEVFDQADLDADGVDEIVARVHGYQSWNWCILKRTRHSWKVVYSGGGGGC
ncbi:MAG TPA: hypothetical protein VH087_15910 [Thermoanaerobaculia bacterium]|nr:hypothetical protein [Thermoanaerobaculia bacterium]